MPTEKSTTTGYLLLSSFDKTFLSKKRFDVNGKRYKDRIPAIKLGWCEER